ncbi:MAG: CheR family methyltransferase [Gemmatimonadaceae bacterium]
MAKRSLLRPQSGEWTQPEFEAIAIALNETAGLVFPPNRRESAESGMRRAMAAACISDPGELRHAIRAAGEVRDILITELTIGETFFLREKGQFDFLKNTVLPELRTAAADRPLRMWSAGCATGEEPYSLAMTLKEVDWPGTASILGTDLAFARLVAAKRARYTAWSMRGVSEDVITRYFQRQGKQFLLRPDLRRDVQFRILNLASADYPSLGSGIEQMDVIFCRNVLIYFDFATIAEIAARLIASLAPGGWLFLGASDPSIAEFVPCEVVLTGAGLAYRPPGTTQGERPRLFSDIAHSADLRIDPDLAEPPVAAPTAEPPLVIDRVVVEPDELPLPQREAVEADDSCEAAYAGANYEAAARLARAAIDNGDDREAIWVVLVRSIANRGDLAAAGEACSAALERHRMSVELTHLHGVLLAEAGRYGDAAVAAKQTLYLSPQYTMAHLALGDALSRTGDVPNARKAFRNAETLLAGLVPAMPVPGGDGAEAGQLLRIARFRLETLEVTPRAVRR